MQNKFAQTIKGLALFEDQPYTFSIIVLWISSIIILASVVFKFVEYMDRRKDHTKQIQKRNHIVETFSMAVIIIVIFNSLQFRFFELKADINTRWLAVFFGLLITTGSTVLHLWSKLAIGRFWSNQIEVQQDHTIVTVGPYAIVRHPMYASAILWLLGLSIMFLNYLAFLMTIILFVPMLIFRSTAEDRQLRNVDKTAFAIYSRNVAQIVPEFGPKISILLRISVIAMLAISLFSKEMNFSRVLLLVCAHFITGMIIKTPKVRFSYINKSFILSIIYIGSIFLPVLFWLFYMVLIFDIWGLFGNCPCMMIYQKYNGCPCFDFIKNCTYKPK